MSETVKKIGEPGDVFILRVIRYTNGPLLDEQGAWNGAGYVFDPGDTIIFRRDEPVRLEVRGWSAQPRPGMVTIRAVRHDGSLLIENYVSRLNLRALEDIKLVVEPATELQEPL